MADEPLPAPYPIKLYRGDTRVWQDAFTDTDTGVPLDLTGHTFLAQIRPTPDSVDVLATMTVDTTRIGEGIITRTLSADDSALLEIGSAYWDLEVTRTSDGFVRTYLAGRVRIRGDVSRA